MPELAASLAAIGAAVVPPLVVPVLLWTAVALAVESRLRWWTGVPAETALAVRRGVLFSLPLAIATPFIAPPILALLFEPSASQAVGVPFQLPEIAVDPDLMTADGTWSIWSLWGAAVLALTTVAGGSLAALGAAIRRLARVRAASPSAPESTQAVARRLSTEVGLATTPHVAVGPGGSAPYTLGARRPLIVVPRDLDGGSLRLALAHEIAHIRRRDFAWTLAERTVAALCAGHPLVHWIARGAALDRECLADANVLGGRPTERRAYADLLLRFAAVPPPTLAVGVGGLSPLKHRITAMSQISSPSTARRARRIGRTLAAVLVAATLGVGVVGAAPSSTETPPLVGTSHAETGVLAASDTTLPDLIGGLGALQSAIVYPQRQRDAGIEGRSIVQFVVDEAGLPKDLRIASSAGDEALDRAALDAVRTARFVPGTIGGERVSVQFAIPITFRLGGDPSAERPPPPPPPRPEGAMPELVGGLASLQAAIVYPEIQKRAGIEGTAFVEFVVDPRGVVDQAAVVRTSGDDALDEAALAAVQAVVFRPSTRDEEPVAVKYIVPVRFELADDE